MAVYTEVDDEDLAAFVAGYGIGAVVACQGIAEGIENTNYLLVTEAGPHVLTLYERRVTRSELPFFLGLMQHLASRGVPCPIPLTGRDGRTLGILSGRPAAIATFLTGMWPRRPGPDHCAALGEAMAAMHLAGRDYDGRRANDLGPAGWRRLYGLCASGADRVRPGLADEIGREVDDLEAAWPTGLPEGIIHGDLFPDNVFFRGGRVSGLIDFYFACTDAFAYDVAIALNAWCFEPGGDFNVTKARRLVQGYRTRRPLDAAELAALPVLARGAALRFLLTRLHDRLFPAAHVLMTPKDPLEYLARLRFHRGIRGPAGYGLEMA